LGSVAIACGGSAFSGADGTGGSSGDSGNGARAGTPASGGKTGSGTAGKANGGKDGTNIAGDATGDGGDIGIGGDVAVGGSTSTSGAPGASGSGGVSGSAGIGGMGGTGPVIDQTCPAMAPVVGNACKKGLTCTYGTDVRGSCRKRASCPEGKWIVLLSECKEIHSCQSDMVEGAQCDPEAAGNGPCVKNGNQYCECAACQGNICGIEPTWYCAPVGSGSGSCPKVAPNEGTTCGSNESKCSYGSCNVPASMPMQASCVEQTWKWAAQVCPL
jgi:hypothetical protein